MKILLAGEGGQGIQVAAEILIQAAFNEGKKVLYIPNFGVEQRGGSSLAFITIDNQPIAYPKFDKADILALLSEQTRPRVINYIEPQTKLILGPFPNQVGNMVALKKVLELTKVVSKESLIKAMEKRFQKVFEKRPELRELNLKALR